ncbi:MAG: respiratory nitrate reductase subunit gamma [Peptococcaceae bacterium]|nr:respiratory nitrate reductase subunit gamma [Peptococcaceae bacterium]
MDQFVGQILPYITVAIFLGGITWRIWRWMIPRIVHNITLAPFPSSWFTAIVLMLWQALSFWNLLKFDRPLWVGAWPMHIALLNIVGGHVVGFYTLGLQFHIIAPLIITEHMSEVASDFLGTFFGLVFLAALLYLLYRRFAVEKVKAVSSASDYLHLVLLIAIAALGNYMRLVPEVHMTYAEVREFLAGLFLFSPEPLPENVLFVWKFFLVQVLMIVFPFSKLMHAFGFFWERWIVNRPYKEAPLGLPNAKLQIQK